VIWEKAADGIVSRLGDRSVTVRNMRGDGYLWRLVGTDAWGITQTESEAKKQAEEALCAATS